MKKKVLTLEKLAQLYNEVKVYDRIEDLIIPRWKFPFLWILWIFRGYTDTSDNWKMYWVNFRNVKYLLKSKEF